MIATKLPMPEGKLGYIGKLYVRGTEVFAVGGTYYAPTLLRSRDGGQAFEVLPTPNTPGLRDLCLDGDVIWVVGEYGWIARSSDHGVGWTRVKDPARACLYSIERDATGKFWITGDEGLVLRSKTKAGKTFERVRTKTKGRVLAIWFDPFDGNPWLLDTTGVLQRWTGKKFVAIEVPAMRTKVSMNSIIRTPAGTLLIAANGGTVLRSADNGAKWKKIPTHVRGDLEIAEVTRYGIFVAGDKGSIVVSYDDGKSFVPVAIELPKEEHLWSIANVATGILIGGQAGAIYHIAKRELAGLMATAFAKPDPVLGALAASIRDGDEGSEMVLEDMLRERLLWG